MKAAFYDRYCDPRDVTVREIEVPDPGPNELLVRVQAAGINPLDVHFMTGIPYLMRVMVGLRRPTRNVPGVDVAGVVEQVGSRVQRFQAGDHVMGWTVGSCAELVIVPEGQLVARPESIPVEQAGAVVVAGQTALEGVRDRGRVGPGDRVLINGASGGVGTFAIQIAQVLGAHVTAVCSAGNAELVARIGANEVIDYGADDFTSGNEPYDVVIDMMGNYPHSAIKSVLTPAGRYVLIGGPKTSKLLGPLAHLLRAKVSFARGSRTLQNFIAQENIDDLRYLAALMEQGLVATVIDRTYPLEEAASAFDHLAGGHARGKIVIVP